MDIAELAKEFGGKGISFEEYQGFPAVRLDNEFSTALVSVYGGHVYCFRVCFQAGKLRQRLCR